MLHFPLIFGNDFHKNRIAAAITDDKLPHALLIDGPEGSGKMTFAKEIAAALNCENARSRLHDIPCGMCSTCKRIRKGGYTDVKVLAKASDKATIGVEEIREFRTDMYLSATEGSYKVYIIDNAEKMTPAAQNALLIILEEPPKNVMIMLLASGTDSILTTIKSRTQYVPMSRFTSEELDGYLRKNNPDASQLLLTDRHAYEAVLVSSGGIIGKANDLLSPKKREENEQKRKEIYDMIGAMRSRAEYKELYEAMSNLPTKRNEFTEALELLINAVGDLVSAKKSDSFFPSFFTSTEEAREMADGISTGRLMRIYDIASEAYAACVKNANITLIAANMSVKIKLA